jgi:lipopolysaccharide biosynthesis protein
MGNTATTSARPLQLEIATVAAEQPHRTGSVSEPDVRMIAFYLPQFHPIPENDGWWEKGFTEWSNVARSRPLFRGHHQPHVPADLGFYDLRLPETRAAQAAQARAHGVYGFCYYHYWFHGQRLLELPFESVLESGEPDFPFCVCWANESWSRRWMGEDRSVLIRQEYSVEDDHRHARWLARAAADSRYICVNGRPLFMIYRPGDLPDPKRTTDILAAVRKSSTKTARWPSSNEICASGC